MGGKPRSRKVQFKDLVEPLPFKHAFSSFREELEAIRDGRKGMSYLSGYKSDEAAEVFEEISDLVHELGLHVILRPRTVAGLKTFDLFILHLEQAWRIPAREALFPPEPARWTDHLERTESRILGYSEEQLAEWMMRLQTTPRGITHDYFEEFFGADSSLGNRRVVSRRLDDIAAINRALLDPVQVWSNGAWVDGSDYSPR